MDNYLSFYPSLLSHSFILTVNIKMTCPNCQQENIHALYTKCPSCATNLVAYKKLAAMEEKYIETAKTVVALEGELLQGKKEYEQQLKKKGRWNFLLGCMLLLVPFLCYFFYQPPPIEVVAKPVDAVDSIQLYQTKLVEKEEQINQLQQTLADIQGAKVRRELKYVVKKGDILNELGKLFYNDSTAWYQIALDNKIYDIRGLPVGDTLTIKYRE